MNVLHLYLDQPRSSSPLEPSAPIGHSAVVNVRQVADAEGSYPDIPYEEAVVIDGRTSRASVRVPDGRYKLEVRLPSGRVLREQRVLTGNSEEPVDFNVGGSPHEWLGWQVMAGNVATPAEYREREKDFEDGGEDPFETRTELFSSFGTEEYFDLGSEGFVSRVTSALSIPAFVLIRPGALEQPEVSRLRPRLSVEHDRMVTLWSASFPELSPELFEQGHGKRAAVIVHGGRSSLLAFLPAPWLTTDGRTAAIELLYDRSAENGRGLRISVLDEERSALLSYLGAGRMAEASVAFSSGGLGERILFDMKEKRRNPLAAVAAAYVGLTVPLGDPRRAIWSPWLENLMNWFPGIPDGGILYARDLLDRAQTTDELSRALGALVQAWERGPPYFAAGVRHLLSGLSFFSATPERYGVASEDLRRIHDQVSEFALLIDPEQAFTVLRFRRDSERD